MSFADTISRILVPIRREGLPFVAGFAVASGILGMVWSPLFWAGMVLTAWCAYFFRDPERVVPVDDDFVISSADGIVTSVGLAVPPAEIEMGTQALLRISVFMNVFSVHVNRAPVRGVVVRSVHKPGRFLNAELDKASEENERNSLLIDGPHGAVATVQVAGLVARRILCWAVAGEEVSAGERFGLIRFGSRVDIYLPEGYTAHVAVGQTAIAGETVLAEFNASRGQPRVVRE